MTALSQRDTDIQAALVSGNTDDVTRILNDELADQGIEDRVLYVDFFNGRFRLCDYSNAIPLTDDELTTAAMRQEAAGWLEATSTSADQD
jgi:hypothetical protein